MKQSSVKGRFLQSRNVGESNFVAHKTERWVIALFTSENNMFVSSAKEYERNMKVLQDEDVNDRNHIFQL